MGLEDILLILSIIGVIGTIFFWTTDKKKRNIYAIVTVVFFVLFRLVYIDPEDNDSAQTETSTYASSEKEISDKSDTKRTFREMSERQDAETLREYKENGYSAVVEANIPESNYDLDEEKIKKADQIEEILSEQFETTGYFNYVEEDSAFYMNVTGEEMISAAELLANGEYLYTDEWDDEVAQTMVSLSKLVSDKLGESTKIIINAPWFANGIGNQENIRYLVIAEDGELIYNVTNLY